MTLTYADLSAASSLDEAQRQNLLSCLLLGLSLLTRVCLACCTDLYADEAYYLAWARHPALGYFDHPPLLAWMLLTLSPRMLGPLLGVGTDLAVFALARAAGLETRRALVACAVFAWLPLNLVLGVLALPDAPLMLCWALALAWLLEGKWTCASIAMGLAMESKYTGVLLVPIALMALHERRAYRALLPGVFIVAVLISPLVAWNAMHDWVSFRFQLHHGLAGSAGLAGAAKYLGAQVGVTAGLVPLALLRGRGAPRVLLLGALVPLAFFLVSSFRAPVEANWPALATPSLAVLAARADFRWLPKWLLGVGTVAWLASLTLLTPGPWSGPFARPLARLHGYGVLSCLSAHRASTFYAPTYQLAGELTAYAHVRAYVAGSDRPSQYDLWPAPRVAVGEDGYWLSEGAPVPASLRARFARVDELPPLTSVWGRLPLHHFRLQRLHGALASTP